MITREETLTFERVVQTAPEEVFRAFTNVSALHDWLCNAAQVDPHQGGRIYLWWSDGYYAAGTFTDVEKGKTLAFTWRGPDDPSATYVRVRLSPQDGRTRVTVEHNGVGSGPEWEGVAKSVRRIWESGLENLEAVLATGWDLRFTRRPMFGLNGGDMLTPERAEKLGVPTVEGFWLGGLVEGMGAANAGLQKDDVLLSLAGKPIVGWQSIGEILQAYQAGDQVEAVYYRGPERRTATVELSRRPMPESLPATAEELEKAVRATYAELDRELDQCFEGVTEAEAEYRIAPDEWNCKEILAHLIAGERDGQSWIAAMVEDVVEPDAQFHSNSLPRLQAITAVCPTIADLVAELKRNEAMTAASAHTLPPELVARKHLYNQIALWLTTLQDHHREHFSEIRALVEAARRA